MSGSAGTPSQNLEGRAGGDTGAESVRTNVSVEMGCPVCVNETVDALHANPIIEEVVVHSAQGCFEVTHHGSVEEVISVINSAGHTIEVASNGELIMAPIRAVAGGACERHQLA